MSQNSFQEQFGEEYGEKSVKKKTSVRAFLPIFGLFLVVAFAAIAFVLSEPLTTLLRDTIDGIPAEDEVQYVVAGMTFLVLLLFSGMVYAMFARKPQLRVTEAELKKERTLSIAEKKARQRRRIQMNKQAAEDLRKGSK